MASQELTTIVLTLFLIPLCLFLMSLWITRLFNKRDQKQEQSAELIKELLAQADKQKEITIKERWDRFSKTQCEIKTKVDTIVNNMHDKVTWDHCNDRMNSLDERLRVVGR